jgi:ABC-type glycerol-3-phosphate transport system substrate-binding protein
MSTDELTLWWWGEDEAAGLGRWLERVCTGFEAAEPGVGIVRRLLRHDQVLPGFPAAARDGTAPNLHFIWNGIYLVENVWHGNLAALDELVPTAELSAIGGGRQSRFRGQTYRAGWYLIPVVWVANRDVLARAGIEALPSTWDEFLDVCRRVKDIGARALTVGDGEGDFSVWWLTHFLTQALDDPVELCRLVLGELDWREKQYCRHWSALAETRDAGFLDTDALRLSLWQGLNRFNEGESAFTLASGPMFGSCRKALSDAATVMLAPRAAESGMAGRPIIDTQGLGISAQSPRRELAASFLCFMHQEPWLRSLWEEVQLFPADLRWPGPGGAADADYARMWEWHAGGTSVAYIANLMPLELHYHLAAEIGQAVLAGRIGGREAGELARARSEAWVRDNPERADLYREWIADVVSGNGPSQWH